MQYECVHCDQRFEVEAVAADGGTEHERPRCPKCLRQHGLRKLDAVKPAAGGPGSRAAALVALAALLLGGGGYLVYTQVLHEQSGGLVPLAADDAGDRAKAAGAVAGELATWLAPDDKLTAFAERAVGDKSAPADKAKAIAAAIAAHASKQAFIPWSRVDVRASAGPLPARQVLALIEHDAGRAQLYPLEVAAFAVAALRSVDVPAMLAEVYRYDGERTALDPSGRLGYYAVALPAATPAAPAALYDVYGARSVAPKAGDYAVLDDAQALGAALALRAMNRLGNLSDPSAALADADAAVKLAPSSPTVRGVRGAVLLASGGAADGARELEAAAQLRTDATRRNNLAALELAKGDLERAAKEVALALSEAPDFAAAHLTLASVHLGRGERDLARAELEKVESLDPNLPPLAMAWAEFYASAGDNVRAMAKAEEGVRMRPKAPETHLMLARIYRQAARYDEMRVQARMVLELTPAAQKERVKNLLQSVLGPTALEEPIVPAAGSDDEAPAAVDDSAKLRLSPQTGSGDRGALQLGGGASKLQLGGGSNKLKLDLGN